MTDSAGNLFAANSYDEYGIPGSGNYGRFQYTGQMWLPEVGVYHYKARLYSPTLGRFLQVDPIGYDDQINLYAYVSNDPVNKTDPKGTYTCTGSKEDCAAAEKAISRIRTASRDSSLSKSQRKILRNVAKFYGKANKKNGVAVITVPSKYIQKVTHDDNASGTVIESKNHPGRIGVLIPKGFSTLFEDLPGSPSSIGKDISKWSAEGERANVMAHEGQHGYDQRYVGQVSETPAKAAGRAVMQSMGQRPFRDLPEEDQ